MKGWLQRVLFVVLFMAIPAAMVVYIVMPKAAGRNEWRNTAASHDRFMQEGSSRSKQPSPYSIRWGTLLACVVDQQGVPIADAEVTFTADLKKDCNGNPTEEPPAWHCTSVRTNEKGEFAIPSEVWENDPDKKRRITACIKANGFLHRDVTLGENWASNNHGRIDIFRVGRLEGVLIDPNGLPVANAPIRMDTSTQYENPASSCHGCFAGTATTDEFGVFVFDQVPPGQHVVTFPGSFFNACNPKPEDEKKVVPFKEYLAWQRVEMSDGQVKTDMFLDLRQSGVTVSGRVVDEYNRPMADVEVQVYQNIILYNDHGSSTFTDHLKSARTDDNGIYAVTHLPVGDYQLKAAYPYEEGKNYKTGEAIDIYLSGSQKLAFNLVLERQDGSLPKPAKQKPLFETPRPDDLGPHELMIVDKSGRGIAGATVEFKNHYRFTDNNESRNWAGAIITADQQGRLTLPNELRPEGKRKKSCQMMLRAEGFDSRWVETDFYRMNNEPRIDLLRRSDVKGRMLDENGQPADGKVSAVSSMTTHKNPKTSSCGGHDLANTFTDGLFEVKGLSEGVHVLRFECLADGKKRKYQPVGAMVVYTQGDNIDDVTVDLASAVCCVRGRVLDRQGKPVSRATVRLQKEIKLGAPYGMTSWPEITASEPTNRKGEYVIEHVMPGVYQLEAALEGNPRKTSDKKTIGLSGDQPVELDLRLKP